MGSRPLHHPPLDQITLTGILYALSDPVRLTIVATLLQQKTCLNCSAALKQVKVKLPKSTCSQHFQILREAGLILCERKGVELASKLRLAEIESRFPKLLSTILKSHLQNENNKGTVKRKKISILR